MVQRTIGNQDRSLFHDGLIKMLVQYQLVTVGKTWDEFLKENHFGLTNFGLLTHLRLVQNEESLVKEK